MHFLLLVLYSGWLYLAAAAVCLAAILVVSWLENRKAAGIAPARAAAASRRLPFLALLAFAVGALAAPPLPWFIFIPAGIVILLHLFSGAQSGSAPRRHASLAASVLALAALIAIELPFHQPCGPVSGASRIFVIGDSLSSGGFGESEPWPEVLARTSGIRVTSLAMPSATTASAVEHQLPRLPAPAGRELVVVAIGGNDMLEGTDRIAYERSLGELLTGIARSGRRMVVLEIPILPGRWTYGAIQRRLVAKHGVQLLPRRILAGTLAPPDHTWDGIHLTQEGHDHLARALGRCAGLIRD